MKKNIITEISRIQSLMNIKTQILTEGNIGDLIKSPLVKKIIKKGENVLDNLGFGKYLDINKLEPQELAQLRSKWFSTSTDDLLQDAARFDEFIVDASKALNKDKIIQDFLKSDEVKSIKKELDTITTRFETQLSNMDATQMEKYKSGVLNNYKKSLEGDQILGSPANDNLRTELVTDLETKLTDKILREKATRNLQNAEREAKRTIKAVGRNTNPITWFSNNGKILVNYWKYYIDSKTANQAVYRTSMMADLQKIDDAIKQGKANVPVIEDFLAKFFASEYEGNFFEEELSIVVDNLVIEMKKNPNFENVSEDLTRNLVEKLKGSEKLKSIFEQSKYVSQQMGNWDMLFEKITPWAELINPLRFSKEKWVELPFIKAWVNFIRNKTPMLPKQQLALLASMTPKDRMFNAVYKQIINWIVLPLIFSVAKTIKDNTDFVEKTALKNLKDEVSNYQAILGVLKQIKNLAKNSGVTEEKIRELELKISKKELELEQTKVQFEKDITEKIKDNFFYFFPFNLTNPYGLDNPLLLILKSFMCMTYIDEVSIWLGLFIKDLVFSTDAHSKEIVDLMLKSQKVLDQVDKTCKEEFDKKLMDEKYDDAIKSLAECLEKQSKKQNPVEPPPPFVDQDTEGTEEGLIKYLKANSKEYEKFSFDDEQKVGEDTQNNIYTWNSQDKWQLKK